ncbi:uracil-DNA glycosylase family protein [Halobacteriaceae archaeon GCM10025711]
MPAFPDPATRNVLEPDCGRCPALVDAREEISWGNGSLDADVMVVGEAPGAGTPDADRWRGGNWTGLAYTARHSGRIVRDLFDDLGYGPADCYVTNAVKCFPEGDDGSNRAPTDEELRTCFGHLRTELDQVDPAVVVTTGKHATRVVLDHEGERLDGFVDHVLDPVDCPTLGVTVLPLLHPAYQHVWLARLGYDREAYVAAVGDRLAALL